MGKGIGVDFGTTNSALALAERGARSARLARFAHAGGSSETFRSILFFALGAAVKNGQVPVFAGPRAIDRYLDEGSGRLVQSMKSYLASTLFTSTVVGGKKYTLEELIAILLRLLREEAEPQVGSVREYPVVFGRPVRFVNAEDEAGNVLAVQRLQRAAAMAGFPEVRFAFEPVAAAFHYESGLDHDELILVADFGGGTSDFCLVQVGPSRRRTGNREKDILGTSGVGLAGDALDGELVAHVVAPKLGMGSSYRSYFDGKAIPIPPWIYDKLKRWHHLSFLKSPETMRFLREMHATAEDPAAIEALLHVIDDDLGYHLYRTVERTKVVLSKETQTELVFSDGPVALREPVERKLFERWVHNEVVAIDQCVASLLEKSGVSPHDVDRVFMTGGTSLVPVVREVFERRFGEERLRGGDELTSVASGLALMSAEDAA